jgi:hypothetical protein
MEEEQIKIEMRDNMMCTQPPIIFSNARPLIDRTSNKFHATLNFSIHHTEPTKSTESKRERETNERTIDSPPPQSMCL